MEHSNRMNWVQYMMTTMSKYGERRNKHARYDDGALAHQRSTNRIWYDTLNAFRSQFKCCFINIYTWVAIWYSVLVCQFGWSTHTHTFLFSFRLLNFTELEFESHHLRTSFTSRILTGFEVRDRAHPHFTQFDFGEFINELSVSICHFVFFLRFQVSVFPVFLRHKMCNVLNYLFTWMFQLEHCIESYKSFVYFLYKQYFCILFWRKDCWV